MIKYIGSTGLPYLWDKIKSLFVSKEELPVYNATQNTSGTAAVTSKPYTASIWRVDLSDVLTDPRTEELRELYTGFTILYKIPIAGNGSYGTLLRIDGTDSSTDSNENLYPVCANVNTMISTRYAVGSIIALTFDATQVGQTLYYNSNSAYTTTASGTGWTKPGCWKIADYDSNTNTIGYQLRTNNLTLPAKFKTYRYRLLFTSPDGTHFVAANASTSTDATASRTPTTEKIDPFGAIVYYGYTTAINAGANFGATYLWTQYTLSLGYSFNNTGSALTLTFPAPVYVKCAPQADGSAIIDATYPYVQSLPSTEDGKIYIFLGIAYNDTSIELRTEHPVYYYKDGAIRQWTNADIPTKVSDLTNDSGFITSSSLPTKVSDLTNDAGYITSYTETDPVFTASAAYGISSSDITNWNGKGTYSKPSGGIPKTDLASAVQTTLTNADTAYSKLPLIIDVAYDATTVPSGTYASITTALAAGREVYVRVDATVNEEGVYILPLVWDDNVASAEYDFGAVYVDGSYYCYITSNDEFGYSREILTTENHTHGNIQSNGSLQTNDINIANGDKLVVTDSSNSNLVARSSLTFDGTTTNQALSKKGTWETFYQKPSGGIPKTDLDSSVQTSLGKADTALQSFTETDPVFSSSAAHGISSSDITNWNGKVGSTDVTTIVKLTQNAYDALASVDSNTLYLIVES